jgi:hypothetical protein
VSCAPSDHARECVGCLANADKCNLSISLFDDLHAHAFHGAFDGLLNRARRLFTRLCKNVFGPPRAQSRHCLQEMIFHLFVRRTRSANRRCCDAGKYCPTSISSLLDNDCTKTHLSICCPEVSTRRFQNHGRSLIYKQKESFSSILMKVLHELYGKIL